MEKQNLIANSAAAQAKQSILFRVIMAPLNWVLGREVRLLLLLAAYNSVPDKAELSRIAAHEKIEKVAEVMEGIHETPGFIKNYARENPKLVKRWWMTRRERQFMSNLVPDIIKMPPEILPPKKTFANRAPR